MKDDSAHAVVAECSPASQVTAVKVMDVMARPDCDGHTADAASAYTQVKLEDAPGLAPKFQSQNGKMFGYVFHDMSGQNHGRTLKIQWFLLNEILYGHPLAGLLWERHLEEVA